MFDFTLKLDQILQGEFSKEISVAIALAPKSEMLLCDKSKYFNDSHEERPEHKVKHILELIFESVSIIFSSVTECFKALDNLPISLDDAPNKFN